MDVAGVNDTPFARGEQTGTLEDTSLVFSAALLLANDTDADTATDADVLHISRVGDAVNGRVELLAGGQVRFVPDANFNGSAAFTYWAADMAGLEAPATVSLAVAAVNDLPVVTGETILSDEDVVLRIDPALLLANDIDVDSGGGGCPIVIDLKNDGIDLIQPEDSNVFMDINGDGWRDRIGWAAPQDAVLAFDLNNDGRVDIDKEVSFVDYLPGARTDLEGLAAFDTNGDGRLTAADTDWARFGLLQDINGNGRQDEGEFLSLDAVGLASIGLTREGMPSMNNGNVVFGTSEAVWADGHVSRAGDVMFAGAGVALPDMAQAALDVARIEQLARLFVQAVATADADAPAVVFVGADSPLDDGAWIVPPASALASAAAAHT